MFLLVSLLAFCYEMPAEILGVEKLDSTLHCKSCREEYSFFKKKKSHRGVAVLNSVALQCSHFHVFVGEFVNVLL